MYSPWSRSVPSPVRYCMEAPLTTSLSYQTTGPGFVITNATPPSRSFAATMMSFVSSLPRPGAIRLNGDHVFVRLKKVDTALVEMACVSFETFKVVPVGRTEVGFLNKVHVLLHMYISAKDHNVSSGRAFVGQTSRQYAQNRDCSRRKPKSRRHDRYS